MNSMKVLASVMAVGCMATASDMELRRARTLIPRSAYAGIDFSDMSIYEESSDKRSLRFKSIDGFEQHWAWEEEKITAHPELEHVVHDADHRGKFAGVTTNHTEVMGSYGAVTGCASCHSKQGTPNAAKNPTLAAPAWNAEMTYTGMGFCPFPWWGRAPYKTGKQCFQDNETATVSLLYDWNSHTQRINHSSCDLHWWGGQKDAPCNSVWVGAEGWIYHTDASFCCKISQPPTPEVRPDFMTLMPAATKVHHQGPYYQGDSLMRNAHTSDGLAFWYVTDPNGNPLGQGENGPLGYVGVEYSVFNGVPTNSSRTAEKDFVYLPSAQELKAKGQWKMSKEDILGALPPVCKSNLKQCQNGR